jgi:succinyl-CoA synthetase beta subunit
MNLHEYQAREILAMKGVAFPPGRVAESPEEAAAIAEELGGAVVVKAQVPAGGRGKAGGVKLCATPDESRQAAAAMLGSSVQGSTVRQVLVTRAVKVVDEFYLGAVVDREAGGVTMMASRMGGVDIEVAATHSPETLVRVACDPFLGFTPYQARELAVGCGVPRSASRRFASTAHALFEAFMECDCTLAEINPLALTEEGDLLALDSKMAIDDNALGRQPALAAMRDLLEEEPGEAETREAGVTYVKLKGNIGCLVNGAGLAMATMDLIKQYGGEPANFLDLTGGTGPEAMDVALRIIFRDPEVRAVLINIFGGITRCDLVAAAVAKRLQEENAPPPVVARLVGTNEEKAHEILSASSVAVATRMSEAAKIVVSLASSGSEAAAR